MELVKGVPITEYCDRHRLTLRERLALFVSVCQALQHAHQKGIIHRDIKPSNVLVAPYDGRPVVKVIDFGVAKATGQRLTQRTMFTEFGAVIGTLQYMSPEQAELNNQDIDTRSDIYSLGVLLYELLTGTTPLDVNRLRTAAFAALLMAIQEEQPPKPSTRLSESNETLPSISAQRQTVPAELPKMVRGELDWIVMKALEKDRSRRYETANGLARDIERYLADEQVEACPPSLGYRIQKTVRRHRRAVIAAGVMATILAIALVNHFVGYVKLKEARGRAFAQMNRARNAELDAVARMNEATAERKRADEQRAIADVALVESEQARRQADAISGFLVEGIQNISLERGPGPELVEVLDQAVATLDENAAGSAQQKAALLDAIGVTYLGMDRPDKGVELLEQALTLRRDALGPDDPATLETMDHLGRGYWSAGNLDDALETLERTLTRRREILGGDHAATRQSAMLLGRIYVARERADKGIGLLEEALRDQPPDANPETLAGMLSLAVAYSNGGRLDEAVPLLEETVTLSREKLGPRHRDTLDAMHALIFIYTKAGRAADAVAIGEETVRLRSAVLGADDPDTLFSMDNLAAAYRAAIRLDDLIALRETQRELMSARLDLFGPDHPETLNVLSELAYANRDAGRLGQAIALWEERLRMTKEKLGADHHDTVQAMRPIGEAYWHAGRLADSIALREDLLPRLKAILGPDDAEVLVLLSNLGLVHMASGNLERAEELFREVVEVRKRIQPADDPQVADALAQVGWNLLLQERFAEAEVPLRECLAIREAKQPNAWPTFNTQSQLGGSLLGQEKYAEAEPLLVHGYERLRGAIHPRPDRLAEAFDRLIALYTASGKPDEVAAWRAKRDQAVRGAGFIQDWLIAVAPLPASGPNHAGRLDAEYIPGEATIEPAAGQTARIGEQDVVWREHRCEDYYIDFNAARGEPTPQGVAYAVCYLIADESRQDLELHLGSDDQAKVFLNGEEIHRRARPRSLARDQDRVSIKLKQGTNVLVFKVVNALGDWYGCARLVDADGRPVEGIEARTTP